MNTLNYLTTAIKQDRALKHGAFVMARKALQCNRHESVRAFIGDARYLTREILRHKRKIRALQSDAGF